jgi:cation:H+ antiporter
MPGLIAPGALDVNAADRDALVMLALSILLFAFCFNIRGQRRITRLEGGIFVLIFVIYQIILFT